MEYGGFLWLESVCGYFYNILYIIIKNTFQDKQNGKTYTFFFVLNIFMHNMFIERTFSHIGMVEVVFIFFVLFLFFVFSFFVLFSLFCFSAS